jgi:glyceraldehyde-3-phosphate dehydrogenase (NAD(P))
MHMHVMNVQLKKSADTAAVRKTMAGEPRLWLVPPTYGITSTASLVEFARDIGRPRHDLWENCIWEESVNIVGGELFFFQAIHQESIVVPENVDCIRALFELEKDVQRCREKTDSTMGVGVLK